MKNSYWIVGKHAVKAALKNTQRTKIRLCTTKEIKLANYNLKGLEVELIFKWRLGDLLVFDRTSLHCSSNNINKKKLPF